MATLALVGLAIDPVRWTAVGVGTGGMPESLGRALVDRVRACGGDFGLLAHELIEQAPTGWRSLESPELVERYVGELQANPKFVRTADRMHDRAWALIAILFALAGVVVWLAIVN